MSPSNRVHTYVVAVAERTFERLVTLGPHSTLGEQRF
jgi:hypothetical protein